MKLCAIYCIWDGEEIFEHSLRNINPLVDGVIIVWSKMSNRGNMGDFDPSKYPDCKAVNYEPILALPPHDNERAKRNAGLRQAKLLGYSHFIMLDCDEFYDPHEFIQEKERIEKHGFEGSVCKTQVYFKKPTLTIGEDPVTWVPFIQRLHGNTRFVRNKRFPFAYDQNGGLRIDPTRHLNTVRGVVWSDITMHHFSHVRTDIRVKIANSSANLSRSTLLEDWTNAKEGYRVKMYNRVLERVENKFNITI